LQIYFDFSGYSDMALGLARLFGIKLPLNFNSPLQATSIIDFWLRWHVSLTRFLTAYIYNPLTLNLTRKRMAQGKPIFGGRNTSIAAFLNLLAMPTMLTMVVSGIWHGAGYTYILWGMLHGMLLCINHAWRLVRPRIWPDAKTYKRKMAPMGFVLTFLSVVAAMVLFRAPTLASAALLWKGMIGGFGLTLPQAVFSRFGSAAEWLTIIGIHPAWTSGSLLMEATTRIGILLLIALLLPNTLQMLAAFEPAIGVKPSKTPSRLVRILTWMPNGVWAAGLACVAMAGFLSLGQLSEFLYWQF
jgi:alginate O-acetyltransferase complex protein AlgI